MTNIVIARGDVLGDVVLVTSMIAPLKQRFPDANIYLLIKKDFFPLFSQHPDISGCIEDTLPYDTTLKDAKTLIALSKHLKQRSISLFIGAWRHPKYAWLSWFAGIPTRLGHGTSWINKCLYTHTTSFNFLNFFNHQVFWNMRLLALLGIKTPSPACSLEPGPLPDLPPSISTRLSGVQKPHIIAVHLEAGILQKTIATDRLIHLIKALSVSPSHVIVLLGRAHVSDVAEHIEASCGGQLISLVGKQSLLETVQVIARASAFFGPDSGLAHVAACFNIPSVIYFLNRTQSPLEWAPWQINAHILTSNHKCTDVCRPTICQKMDCREGVIDAQLELAIAHISSSPTMTHEAPSPTKDEIKSHWLMSGTTIGIYSNSASLRDSVSQQGFRAVHLGKSLSAKALKTIVADKNINVIVIDGQSSSFFRRIKLKIVSIWASNFIHFKPIILQSKSASDVVVRLHSMVTMVPGSASKKV